MIVYRYVENGTVGVRKGSCHLPARAGLYGCDKSTRGFRYIFYLENKMEHSSQINSNSCSCSDNAGSCLYCLDLSKLKTTSSGRIGGSDQGARFDRLYRIIVHHRDARRWRAL